jgi:hypothetical protein
MNRRRSFTEIRQEGRFPLAETFKARIFLARISRAKVDGDTDNRFAASETVSSNGMPADSLLFGDLVMAPYLFFCDSSGL